MAQLALKLVDSRHSRYSILFYYHKTLKQARFINQH